jgi:hypothetical protein
MLAHGAGVLLGCATIVSGSTLGKERVMADLRLALHHIRRGDWEAAHALAQADGSALAAWLHGVLHVIEGDTGNAQYWYMRAKRDFHKRGSVEEELAGLEAALLREPPPAD